MLLQFLVLVVLYMPVALALQMVALLLVQQAGAQTQAHAYFLPIAVQMVGLAIMVTVAILLFQNLAVKLVHNLSLVAQVHTQKVLLQIMNAV